MERSRTKTGELAFSVQNTGKVSLKVYDMLGRHVATLVNKQQRPGLYQVKFDAARLPSGTYIYQLKTGNFIQSKKMLLLK